MRKARMKMSRLVKRIIPFESCDIAAIQKWLEDMAREGYFYKDSGMIFANFEVSEPKERRYRVDFCNVVCGKIPEDKQELYESCGWTVVSELKSDLVVLYTDDPEAPEIYTDQNSFLEPLKKIRKKHKWFSILFLILFMLTPLGYTVQSLVNGGDWVGDLINFGTVKFIIAVLVAILLLVEFIVHLKRSRHLKKQTEVIECGGTMPLKENYGVKKTVGTVLLPLTIPVIIAWFILFVSSTGMLAGRWLMPIDIPEDRPFPLIAEINNEEGEIIAKLDAINAREFETGSSLTEDSDFSAPRILWLDQFSGGGEDHFFQYSIRYYELRSEKLAKSKYEAEVKGFLNFDAEAYKRSMDKMIEKMEEWGGEYETTYDGIAPEYTCTMLDVKDAEAYYVLESYSDYDVQYLVIRCGNVFEIVSYQGASDLSQFVDLYISYLEK